MNIKPIVIALCLIPLVVSCTCLHASETNGDKTRSYTRVSLGGDFGLKGLEIQTDTNGVTRFVLNQADDKREKSFTAACQSLERIADTVAKLYLPVK